MGKRYDMTNACLRVQMEDGVLRSIRPGASCGASKGGGWIDTEYADGTAGFGALCLTWTKGGERREWEPCKDASFVSEGVQRSGRRLVYEWRAHREELEVAVSCTLEADGLHCRAGIRNHSRERLELEDCGILLSCHTHFAWGENAARQVLGHHYVGGHGSHSTFSRCDGTGPILAVMPEGDSQWVYYDCPRDQKGEPSAKNAVTVYALSGCAAGRVQESGARLRIPPRSRKLDPGEEWSMGWQLFFAAGLSDCADQLMKRGQAMAESIPGYTVPRDQKVRLCIRSLEPVSLEAEEGRVKIQVEESRGERHFFTLEFQKLGETDLCVCQGERRTHLYYFITQPVRILLEKRAAFLTAHQVQREDKWYRGLFAEVNNETGAELGPDNYDKIKGWRIYEVTCDDPGLSKPAFLSTKQTVAPAQEQVAALDEYIRHFVWGGLQQTWEEPYPCAIYGIPDWYTLRNSEKPGNDGRTHLWRIYDYPHIALMYYNMYETARLYPGMSFALPRLEYLRRAYGTALALFCVPSELDDWTAYHTGLYNELVIPDIVEALREEGLEFEADRLDRHWKRKAAWFVQECQDVFGSEYPFDTTGFESTQALAAAALREADAEREEGPFRQKISYDSAAGFLEKQKDCNIACRGVLEPAYFWYGSDYRGNNLHYTLSYMSQMGGWALLDYACYHAAQPARLLRLAYGSLLSSWALLNAGDEESGYGYWFPGKEMDGCACGGFEPLYETTTWLEQPCKGGAWYYSCEIDLGFCGGVRGAAAVLVQDPDFGLTAYGARLERQGEECVLHISDGVGRRFHHLGDEMKLHLTLKGLRLEQIDGVRIGSDGSWYEFHLEQEPGTPAAGEARLMVEGCGEYRIEGTGLIVKEGERQRWKPESSVIRLVRK